MTVRWALMYVIRTIPQQLDFISLQLGFSLNVRQYVRYMYVIRNLYFYNLISCENVPDTYFPFIIYHYTYFSITTPIFLSLPLFPQFPVQTLRPCVEEAASPLPDCPEGYIYVSRTPYCTFSLVLLSLLMYVSRTIPLTSL